jgi:Chemoreceptor zinc-binding domain
MLKSVLLSALAEHTSCKECLRRAIETGIPEPPSSIIREETMCEFGKWLYSLDLSEQIAYYDYYMSIRQAHADFHQAAANVMEQVELGNTKNAIKMVLTHGEYSVQANKLRTEILNWAQSLSE